jgi:hypothetical protein
MQRRIRIQNQRQEQERLYGVAVAYWIYPKVAEAVLALPSGEDEYRLSDERKEPTNRRMDACLRDPIRNMY